MDTHLQNTHYQFIMRSAKHQPKKRREPLCSARGAMALRGEVLGKVPFFGFVFWASKKGTRPWVETCLYLKTP